MINRFTLLKFIWLVFLLCFSCSSDTQKREDYKISLIGFEEIVLNPDSLFTNISFNYYVLYDFIEGIVDGGPFPVSDVEVVWISNFYYSDNNTGLYSKCDKIKDSYFQCDNIDKSMFVIDTLSTPGENDIYTNKLELSNLMIGDTLILHYVIYKNGNILDYYYKDTYNDIIILPIN
tara:strand:+ start:148 stop:675 length:528 start_codon:yes stop_codon:yes gene_type:complete